MCRGKCRVLAHCIATSIQPPLPDSRLIHSNELEIINPSCQRRRWAKRVKEGPERRWCRERYWALGRQSRHSYPALDRDRKKNTGRTVFVSCVGERAIRDIVEELERERYELRSVLLGGCHDFSFGLPRPRALPVTTALRDARANPRSKMVTASAVVK